MKIFNNCLRNKKFKILKSRSIKKQKVAVEQSGNISRNPQFVFAEPFCFFTLHDSKNVEKVILARGRNILKTDDFFYAYRKIGNKLWCLCVSARAWNEKCMELKTLENAYPALLHLKPGKYAFFSEAGAVYLVDFQDIHNPKIFVSPSLEEGYKIPAKDDYLPPQYRLKWSYARRDFLFLPLVFLILAFICFLLSAVFYIQNSHIKKEILAVKQVYRRIEIKYKRRGNLPGVLKSLTDAITRIPWGAYITKITYDKEKHEVVLNIECWEKCVLPFQNVRPIGKDSYEVRIKEK